jgi:hypothetical protein
MVSVNVTRLLAPLSLATGLVLGACGQKPSEDDQAYVRVPRAALSADFVENTGFVRDHGGSRAWVTGWLPRSAVATAAQMAGGPVTELDERLWARVAHDVDTLAPRPDETVVEGQTSSLFDDPRDGQSGELVQDYHDYDALTTALRNLADEAPELVRLESAGRSGENRELWYVRLGGQVDHEDGGPKLIYIANMHGDETVGREMMVYLLQKLVREYETSPRIKNLVDHTRIWIMPSMNPDGFERGQRGNVRGRDLNRNFPDFTSDNRDIPAGREPETAAVMRLHDTHEFTLAMNHHGGDVCFNMPWDTQPNDDPETRFGDDSVVKTLGREYADANPTMRANNSSGFDNGLTYGYEWYEVNGGLQDWSIHYRNATHATSELSYTKYPEARHLPRFWRENEEPLVRYLERGRMGLHLKIFDEATQAPIEGALIEHSGSSRKFVAKSATVHRLTLPGTWTVKVSAPGYESKQLELTAEDFSGSFTEVGLNRL